MRVRLIEDDPVGDGGRRAGCGRAGFRKLVRDLRRMLAQAEPQPVAVGIEVVRRPPAGVAREVDAAVAPLGQGWDLLLRDRVQHMLVGTGKEDDAMVGVPELDRDRAGAAHRLDPLVPRRLEVDHGHSGDAALGQVLVDQVGLLQPRLRPGEDGVLDLDHRRSGPARGWRRQEDSRPVAAGGEDQGGDRRQKCGVSPSGWPLHVRVSIRKGDSVSRSAFG